MRQLASNLASSCYCLKKHTLFKKHKLALLFLITVFTSAIINTLAAGYEYIVPRNWAKIKHILVVLPTA